MSAHTPAPWRNGGAHFALRSGGRTYLPVFRPGNDPVAIAYVHRDVDGYGKEEGEANASLIEAAPDLLALLKEARAELAATTAPTDGDVRVVFTPAHRKFLRALLERIDAVLARAGEGV